MIDTLVQHLLEEIAMDGQAGTDVTRLASFIHEFYSSSSSSTSTDPLAPSTSTSTAQQKTDAAFLSFVWDTLLVQEDVHVGVLTPIKPEKEEEEEEEEAASPASPAENDKEEDNPTYRGGKQKGKGKNTLPMPKRKKKAKDIGKQGTHQLERIEGERRGWSRDKLMERYGEGLRISVGDETAWVAITGSAMRPTSLTPPVYTVLEHVSRARGEGATVITIGHDLGVDQKSAFHFVRVAVNLGIVKKFRTIEHGAWTNRILHTRYLSSSPHWAIYKASDEGGAEGEEAAPDSDDDGAGAGGGQQVVMRRVGAIGRNHIVTNPGLVRKRIVRALRGREKWFMPHGQMASAIGLYNYNGLDLRRLNQILTNMCKEGILEKTLVSHQAANGSGAGGRMMVQCLRLLKREDHAEEGSNADDADADAEQEQQQQQEEEEDDDDSPHPLALISIERQLIDLLVEAGKDGLTHADIAHSLGSLPLRTVDQMLARLSRQQSLPPHLKDLTLHLVTETVGREKRTRWFTLAGYLLRCDQDGVFDAAEKFVPTLSGSQVGGWAEVKSSEVYGGAEERWEKVKGLDLKKAGRFKGGSGLGASVRQDPWRVVKGVKLRKKRKKRGERAAELEEIRRVKKEEKGAGKVKSEEMEDELAEEQEQEQEQEEEDDDDEADSTTTTAAVKPKPKKASPKPRKKSAAPPPPPPRDPTPEPASPSRSASPAPKPSKSFNFDGTPVIRGRPRKSAPKAGQVTYYERRKMEDEERAKIGLEPRQVGEKKNEEVEKIVKERVEEIKRRARREAGEESEEEEEEESVVLKKRGKGKGKGKKKVEEEEDGGDANAEEKDKAAAPKSKSKTKTKSTSKPKSTPATKTRSGRTSIAVLQPIEIDELESDDDNAEEEMVISPATTKGKGKGRAKEVDLTPAPGWAPPRPRSTANDHVDEDSPMLDAEVDVDPTPPASGKRIPRKSDFAKGKEKEAPSTRKRVRTSEAPDPTEGDSEEEEPVGGGGASSAKEKAKAPLSSAQRPKKRMRPVVEVFVKSPKKKVVAAAVEKEKEKEKEKEVEVIEVDELESEEEVEVEKEGGKEKEVQEIVIDEDEDDEDVGSNAPQLQSDAVAPTSELSISSSPAPSGFGTGSATPIIPRVGRVPRTTTEKRFRSRGLGANQSTPKSSHSFLAKQMEIITFLEHPSVGGFCEYDIHFVNLVRKFFNKYHPDKLGAKHTMDKRSANEIVSGLLDRKLIKKTTVSTPAGRTDIILLAALPFDDERFTAFCATLSGRKLTRTGKAPDLREAEDLTLDDGLAPRALGILEEPGVDDDSDIVRNYFRRIPGVAGAKYGALYGRIARARHLHHWLLQWVHSAEVGANLISRDPVVFTHPTLTSLLPLGDYLRIVTLAIDSREFDDFVADPANLTIPLASLPKNILAMLKPDTAIRQRALWPAVETLVHLGLLLPLVLALGDESQTLEHTYQRPTKSFAATHWQLNPQAPVYAFARKNNPLVSIVDVTSSPGATFFWEKLHEVSFPGNVARHPLLDEADAGTFPLSFEGAPAGFASKIMTSSTKWHADYMLLRSQRKYLTKLVTKDNAIFDNEEALTRIAEDTVAPKAVVERYMRHVIESRARRLERQRKKGEKDRKSGKARRKRRKLAEGQEGEDEWEDEPAAGVEAPRTRRARGPNKTKHTDASAARELAFAAIIDRFKAEHGQPTLPPPIIEFLQRRFCYSRRGLIDTTQLQSELGLLLPEGQLSSYRSIVPANIRRAVRLGDDPYSLPAAKMFSSRKSRSTLGSRQKALPKPLADKPVGSANRDADSGADGEGDDQAMSGDDEADAAAAAAAPPPMLDDAEYPSLIHNRQNDFLSTPARPAPELKENGRLPRKFFTAEQDDLLLDAAAILRARAEYVGRRVVWTPLSQLFSDIPSSKMRHHFKRLTQSKEEQTYHDRLVEAWHVEWEKKRGSPELPDEHSQDQLRFELVDFVRCLRATVDKQALRLTGPRPVIESVVPIVTLPATLAEFEAKFVIDARSGNKDKDEALRWDRYWKTGVSGANREDEAAAAPFSTICSTEELPAGDHELLMTEEALKMLYTTPEERYTSARGDRFLKPFESHLDPALKDLLDNAVIIKPKGNKESTRRQPGRGHHFSDRFHSTFEDLISPSKSLIASHKERELLALEEDKSVEWPIFALEGDMISLIRLASEGKVTMNVDTSTTAAFRDPTDYQTRQKDDEAYELSVFVSANHLAGPFDIRAQPPRDPPTFPRDGHTADPTALAAARSELESTVTDEAASALKVLDLVTAAGVAGLSFNILATQLPHLDSNALNTAQTTLTSSTPPLAFFAGEKTVALVASQFLPSWTVAVLPRKEVHKQRESVLAPEKDDATSQDQDDEQEKEPDVEQTPEDEDDTTELRRIFPAPWRDLHGDVIPAMWEKATGWIKGLLLLHSGATTQQLFARSDAVRLLTLPQVLMLLETLEEWGVIERRDVEAVAGEGEGEREKQLGWEDARFYLTASWE